MAITRRQFLKCSGTAAAGALLGPSLFENVFVREAFALTGDRYFVVIFLDGGNDGLNTVVPYANGTLRTAYAQLRHTGSGGLQLSQSDLAATTLGPQPTAQFALHPGFTGLMPLYNAGKVAVIQGCGYPDYSLSHDQSRTIWRTGNPLGVTSLSGTGWMGRYLINSDDNYSSLDIPGVTISDSVAPEFRETVTSVLAIDRLDQFGFPYDDFNSGADTPAKRQAFAALCTAASGGAQPSHVYIGDSGRATLISSENYPDLNKPGVYTSSIVYPQSGTARRLQEVAKIINGVNRHGQMDVPDVSARFFQLENGGYDTHSDQGAADPQGQHYQLHQEVGDAVKAFYDDCVQLGVANKVCILVWSEFSRRPEQNDNGTDHGSQGPMFVIGGGVHGGVYGNHPDIGTLDSDGNTSYSQAAGPYRSTDFRDVYGTVLKHWLNMSPSVIVPNVLQLDPGDPTLYWTSANFDLGFL